MVQEGDLLYIRPRNSSTSGGMIMKFESSYRGEEDLSYHAAHGMKTSLSAQIQ